MPRFVVLLLICGVFQVHLPLGLAQVQLSAADVEQSAGATMADPAETASISDAGLPLLTIETGGFSSEIRAITFSADGAYLAASSDADIRIWEIASGELLHTIRGFSAKESGKITSIAADPAGEYLAVAVQTSQGAYLRTCHLNAPDITKGYWGNPAMIDEEPLPGINLGPRSARELTFSRDGKYLGCVATTLQVDENRAAKPHSEFLFFDWQQDFLDHSFAVPPLAEGMAGLSLFGTQRLVQAGRFLGTDRYYVMANLGKIFDLETKTEVTIDADPDLDWLGRLWERLGGYYQRQQAIPQGYLDGDLRHRMMAFAYMTKQDGRDIYQCDIWRDESDRPSLVCRGFRWAPSELKVSGDGNLVGVGDVLGNVFVFSAINGETLFRTQSIIQPLYAASLDQQAAVLALGNKPHHGSAWKLNDYAALDHGFDLQQRRFVKLPDGNFPRPRPEITSWGVTSTMAKVKEGSLVRVAGLGDDAYSTEPIAKPFFTWTLAPGAGDNDLFLLRGGSGYLVADFIQRGPVQARFGQQVRGFLSAVASSEKSSVAADVNVTADGQFVTAAWTDGTACIYRLQDFLPQAFAVFPFAGTPVDLQTVRIDQITDVNAAGQLRVGDQIRSINGLSMMESLQLMFSAPESLQAGVLLQAEVLRDGQPKQIAIRLVESPTSLTTAAVAPVLTFFATSGDDWILFTPQGYYDASLGGHDLIGWKVNRSPDETATFYSARQLRRSLYRPDIIDRVVAAIRRGAPDTASPLQSAAKATQSTEAADARSATVAGTDLPKDADQAVLLDLRSSENFASILPPIVSVTGLPADRQTQLATVTLQVEAESQNDLAVRSIVILVNGRPPVGTSPQSRRTQSQGLAVTQTIELVPGRNEIAVLAINAAATSTPEVFTVTRNVAAETAPQPADRLMPKLYVLSVGVSDYQNDDYDLQFAAKDATAFADAFSAQQGKFYRQVETKVLTDRLATRSAIQDAMDWLLSSVTQHDLAVIFISGHGVFDARRNYYFCPHEVDADRLRSTALANTEIERLVQELPCKVMLFVDTCHSGSSRGAKSLNVDPWTDLVSDEVGAILFASSTPQEISLESEQWGHGAFAKALLDAMNHASTDVNADGFLSISELDLSLSERVKELTGGRQHPTTQKPSTIRNFNFAVAGGE